MMFGYDTLYDQENIFFYKINTSENVNYVKEQLKFTQLLEKRNSYLSRILLPNYTIIIKLYPIVYMNTC